MPTGRMPSSPPGTPAASRPLSTSWHRPVATDRHDALATFGHGPGSEDLRLAGGRSSRAGPGPCAGAICSRIHGTSRPARPAPAAGLTTMRGALGTRRLCGWRQAYGRARVPAWIGGSRRSHGVIGTASAPSSASSRSSCTGCGACSSCRCTRASRSITSFRRRRARAPGDRLRLVVLGDSTAAGVGVDRPEHALPHLIAQRIADAESPRGPRRQLRVGRRARRHLVPEQLPARARPIRRPDDAEGFLNRADLVAVVIGANDATHRTRPARFRCRPAGDARGDPHRGAPNARVVHAGIPAFRGALRTLEPLMFLTDHVREACCGRSAARSPSARASRMPTWLATSRRASAVEPTCWPATSSTCRPSGYAAWADVIVEALSTLDADARSRLAGRRASPR